MQKELLLKELEKYNNINKYLITIKENIDDDIKKIAIINNHLNQECNIITMDLDIRKKLLNNQSQLEKIIGKIDDKIKNITMQLNGIQ
jgi:hypothetical protein